MDNVRALRSQNGIVRILIRQKRWYRYTAVLMGTERAKSIYLAKLIYKFVAGIVQTTSEMVNVERRCMEIGPENPWSRDFESIRFRCLNDDNRMQKQKVALW
jgi:hypothetical protein